MKKAIQYYRRISEYFREFQIPLFTYTTCKFHPSCSEYAELAIERHGNFKGSMMAISRIARCNPFSKGGVDLP